MQLCPLRRTVTAPGARAVRAPGQGHAPGLTTAAKLQLSNPGARRVRRSPVKTGRRARDPHYEREKRRYEEPLPSREYVLDVLIEAGVPVPEDELAEMLEIKTGERIAFQRRLDVDGARVAVRRGDAGRGRHGAERSGGQPAGHDGCEKSLHIPLKEHPRSGSHAGDVLV